MKRKQVTPILKMFKEHSHVLHFELKYCWTLWVITDTGLCVMLGSHSVTCNTNLDLNCWEILTSWQWLYQSRVCPYSLFKSIRDGVYTNWFVSDSSSAHYIPHSAGTGYPLDSLELLLWWYLLWNQQVTTIICDRCAFCRLFKFDNVNNKVRVLLLLFFLL